MANGFTKFAIDKNFVRVEGDSTYFGNMRTGNYRATGEDINGRTFHRDYIIDQSDRNSPWAMWNDFNGRWGLTRIYWYEVDANGKQTRRKIYDQWG